MWLLEAGSAALAFVWLVSSQVLHKKLYVLKKHLKNEQRSRDAAAKKRTNTSGVEN